MYYISFNSMYKLQSKRLVTTSTSLGTQTGYNHFTIQVLNIRVWFLEIWYTPFTSVHYNLEHELAIVTESFSPLNLNYTTSLVKVWIRSDMIRHTIVDTVHLSYTTTSKNQFELVIASLKHVLSRQKDSPP